MGAQRFCDICNRFKVKPNGEPAVHRYGLSRQIPVPGKLRNGRPHSQAFKRERHFGGIDMCDECWQRIAQPRQRPELRGKTGPQKDPLT